MRFIFSVVFLFLLVNLNSALAQKNVIRSRVKAENQVLESANVNLISLQDSSIRKSVLTDTLGNFMMKNIPVGKYVFSVSYIGYIKGTSKPFEITALQDSLTIDPIILKARAGNTLNEISIVGTKKFIEKKIDRTVINLQNSVLAKGNSALEVLESAPGVGTGKEGVFSLRGKEGVLVMIDDKPTYLSATDLANLLRNTPGSNIQTIELITNPPSKYEAQGSAGIINIKFKKNTAFGANYSVNSMVGYGRYYKWSDGFTSNFRTKNYNLNLNYITSSNKRFNDQTVQRTNINDGTSTFFDQTADRVRKIDYNHFSVGYDYFLNDKNTIKLLVDGSFNNAKQLLTNHTAIGKSLNSVDSLYKSDDPLKSNYNDLRYNLNYTSVLDTGGSEFSFDLNYGKFNSKEATNYYNSYFLPGGNVLKPSDTVRINSPLKISIYSFKTDYSYPFHHHQYKLDVGLKSSFVKTDNDFGYDSLRNNIYYNTILSNHFIYNENVNAAYFNFNLNFQKFSVEFGLRGEQTNSKGQSVATNSTVDRHYLDLFPSVFFNRKFSDNNSINFSYSRRIDRPDYEDLNPFIYFLDQFTYSQGNPYLKPQYSNSFEFTYSLKEKYMLTLGYIRVNQVMSEIVKTDTLSKTLIFTYDNLAHQTSYNASLNIPINITPWWSDVNYFNGYLSKLYSPDIDGVAVNKQKYSYTFTVNNSFRISKTFRSEMNFSYQSPYIIGTIFYNKPIYNFDVGVNQSFSDNKFNINLTLKDVFDTKERAFTSLLSTQQYQYHQKLESRIVRLTLSYRFGRATSKQVKKRTVGSQEESDRIKGAN